MDILLTYDVSEGNPDRHREIKDYLVNECGYHVAYIDNDQYYDLPNTTVWKQNASGTQTGLDDLMAAVAAVNRRFFSASAMRVEKAVCVQFGISSGIPSNR